MDFSFDADQLEIQQLAEQILTDKATAARLRELDVRASPVDEELWQELARAGLLGMALGEDVGGGGAGFLEFCLVLQCAGAAAAHLPLIDVIVSAALPVERFGSKELRARLLPSVADGSAYLTAAPDRPDGRATVRAARDGEDWTLSGVRSLVVLADRALRVLVTADDEQGRAGLFCVDPQAAGVLLEPQQTMTGRPAHRVTLSGVRVPAEDVLLPPGEADEALAWLRDRVAAAVCVEQLGVCAVSLRLTAEYVSEREQFGRPIGTFQAVAHRVADAYIDLEAIRLTTWQAVWLLDQDGDAREELAIAKWWAADAGPRILQAAQHLHGGISVDLDYPVHRYSLLGKRNELRLGGPTAQLRDVGALLARD
ncbi:acyl-CoA dehydrogenase family protein [Acrocarpospora catenulata]|uniref:acyl-CoA dehydrogenase family protein n=1 Tax=Acrocarpospora catenulata TaxID=2836182 RepID=UPI001BD99CBA|nr:acyl-CoA dehydrogenase family protein [Acrocarpospora catenulata]